MARSRPIKEKQSKALEDARRSRVAALHVRGLSEREIVAALGAGDNPITNPQTGEPYSLTTIHNDLDFLRMSWRAAAAAEYGDLKGQQLAELRALRRAAWAVGDREGVRKCLVDEVKLTGTAAPFKVAPTDPTGNEEYSGGWSDDELEFRLRALLDARTEGAGDTDSG